MTAFTPSRVMCKCLCDSEVFSLILRRTHGKEQLVLEDLAYHRVMIRVSLQGTKEAWKLLVGQLVKLHGLKREIP